MAKFLFAAAAAFALFSAQPVRACEDCKNCPKHQVAAGDKKDAEKPAACACAGQGSKECKCGEKCQCPHCHQHQAAPKADEKKAS
jgi:hypothetical protein